MFLFFGTSKETAQSILDTGQLCANPASDALHCWLYDNHKKFPCATFSEILNTAVLQRALWSAKQAAAMQDSKSETVCVFLFEVPNDIEICGAPTCATDERSIFVDSVSVDRKWLEQMVCSKIIKVWILECERFYLPLFRWYYLTPYKNINLDVLTSEDRCELENARRSLAIDDKLLFYLYMLGGDIVPVQPDAFGQARLSEHLYS